MLHLVGQAFGDLLAELHHHHPIHQVHHEVHVVFDDQRGQTFGAQFAQQVGEGLLLLVTQAGGRLVEDRLGLVAGSSHQGVVVI